MQYDLLGSEIKPDNINYFVKCKCCGWLGVEVCTNDGFLNNMEEDYQYSDYWVYCLNKGCVNHHGYPVGQGLDNISKHFDWLLNVGRY